MKLPLHVLRDRSPLEIQMTPMIDVVFLLLVFFVWTAGFQVAERLLPSNVSAEVTQKQEAGAGSDEPPPPEADYDRIIVRVTLDANGPAWSVNDQPAASLDEVRNSLRAIAEITRNVPVVLHPEPEVPLHHVISLYDMARQLGFEKVSMAARWQP